MRRIFYIRRKTAPLVLVSLEGLKKGEGETDRFVYSLSESISREEEEAAGRAVMDDIDRELSLYIQEKSYIKRLLISADVFLAVYFFCSFVIRDPVPMADELALAFISAALLWAFMRKKDYRSALVSADRIAYERALRAADFSYESEVRYIEEYAENLLSYDLKTISSLIASGDVPELSEPVSAEFADALMWHVMKKEKLAYRYAKDILSHSKNTASVQKSIIKDVSTGLLDPVILALFIIVSRNKR